MWKFQKNKALKNTVDDIVETEGLVNRELLNIKYNYTKNIVSNFVANKNFINYTESVWKFDMIRRKILHVVEPDYKNMLDEDRIKKNIMDLYNLGKNEKQRPVRVFLEGEYTWVTFYYTVFEEPKNREIIATLEIIDDLTEVQKMELSHSKSRERDLLTNLMSRGYFEQNVERAMMKYKNGALLLVDLDEFKYLNGRLGDTFGDFILTDVAEKLRRVFEGVDMIGRTLKDEFVIYIPEYRNRSEITQKAIEVINEVSRNYDKYPYQIFLSCSVGMAAYPEQAEDFKQLYMNAKQAKQRVKVESKSGYAFYKEEVRTITGYKR